MTRAGEKIKVKTKEKTYEGIRMPSPDAKTVVIKLKSGYNLGINKNKVQNIISLGKPKKTIKKHTPQQPKAKLKTISILHTGGTIASQVDYETGAVSAKFTPEDLIAMFPELKDIANIKSRLIANMASDDMRFAHYNIIAKEIEKEILKGTDGIIITHGTDTLHYTSAALAFMLDNLPVPVILVGSQKSSDRGSSDAAMNLICACKVIAETTFCDVAICMHASNSDDQCNLLQATKTRKMHTSRRDAFQVINDKPWAEIPYQGRVKFLRDDYRMIKKGRTLTLKLMNQKLKIGIIKAHPQMFAKEFETYMAFDGVVLEGTGLGHFPITEMDSFTKEHKRILASIKKLTKKMPVVMAPQTIYGRLQMHVYTPGRIIQETGVIGNYSDMTPETTFIKLAWLLSNDPKNIKEKMQENLVGELNKRIGKEF